MSVAAMSSSSRAAIALIASKSTSAYRPQQDDFFHRSAGKAGLLTPWSSFARATLDHSGTCKAQPRSDPLHKVKAQGGADQLSSSKKAAQPLWDVVSWPPCMRCSFQKSTMCQIRSARLGSSRCSVRIHHPDFVARYLAEYSENV